jgi:hypothetical protein
VGLVIALGTFYGLSYQSAQGLAVEIGQVSRKPSLAGDNVYGAPAIEFDVDAHVWSTNSLDTSIDQVRFQLTVGSVLFPTIYSNGSRFSPHNYAQYNLTFLDTNSREATDLFSETTARVTLSITALVSAGLYSGINSPESSRTVTISRVDDTTIGPSVLNDCHLLGQSVALTRGGGVTIQMSSTPDSVGVSLSDSRGRDVFSQGATELNSTIRLPPDTYYVTMQRIGTSCAGPDQLSGSITFWHEATS